MIRLGGKGAGLALLVLAALLAVQPAAWAQRKRPILAALPFMLEVLDPTRGTAGWQLVTHGIAETLFVIDEAGKITPGLAESARPDGASWIVRLAAGRKFSDGSAVEANAVGEALSRSARANPLAVFATGPLQMETLDPLTLRVTPTRPVNRIETVLAAFPAVIYKNDARGRPIFTGPYLVGDFRANLVLRLDPNPHYPSSQPRAPIPIRRMPDANARAMALESGEVDLAGGLSNESLARLSKLPDIEIRSAATGYQYMIVANLLRLPLAIPNVRKAIDLAIDRAALVKALGHGEPATGLFPTNFHIGDGKVRPFDASRANRLLDQAGLRRDEGGFRLYNNKRVAIELLAYPQRPDFLVIAPLIKGQLAAIGFDIKIRIAENVSQLLQTGDFELALWAMHPAPAGDAGYVFSQHLRDGGPRNYGRYESRRLETILEDLAKTPEPDARAALVARAQAVILEDAPMIFLMTPQIRVGISRRAAVDGVLTSDAFVLRADIGVGP